MAPLLAAPFGRNLKSATPAPLEYRLRFYHTYFYHTYTDELPDIVYRRGENYVPGALAELDHDVRDHRTGEVRPFDSHLFDLLHDLTASLNDSWSHGFLRTCSAHTGVAFHSVHMQTEAIDIRLPGIST
jgi:uncharacterized protein YcbK (DUF882 family)